MYLHGDELGLWITGLATAGFGKFFVGDPVGGVLMIPQDADNTASLQLDYGLNMDMGI